MALRVVVSQYWVILLVLKCHFSEGLEVTVVVKIVFFNTHLLSNRALTTQEIQKSGKACGGQLLSHMLIWYSQYYYYYYYYYY